MRVSRKGEETIGVQHPRPQQGPPLIIDCDAAVVGGRSDGGPNVDESIHPYRAISTINFFGMHEIKTSTRAGIAPYLPASRTV